MTVNRIRLKALRAYLYICLQYNWNTRSESLGAKGLVNPNSGKVVFLTWAKFLSIILTPSPSLTNLSTLFLQISVFISKQTDVRFPLPDCPEL